MLTRRAAKSAENGVFHFAYAQIIPSLSRRYSAAPPLTPVLLLQPSPASQLETIRCAGFCLNVISGGGGGRRRRYPQDTLQISRYLRILDLPCGAALHAHASSTIFIGKMIRGEMICGTLPEYRYWRRDGSRERYPLAQIAVLLLQYYGAAPPCTPTPPSRRPPARPVDAI